MWWQEKNERVCIPLFTPNFPAKIKQVTKNGIKQWICGRFVFEADQGIDNKDKQAVEKLWCAIQRHECKIIKEVISMKEIEETEEDFYNLEYLEGYVEDDEINAEEEGFMIGYLG